MNQKVQRPRAEVLGFLCVKVALVVGATEDSTLFHPMAGWLEKLFVHI